LPRKQPTGHHSVYVVYLRNPKGDGKPGYYVGMTGLSPDSAPPAWTRMPTTPTPAAVV